MFSSCFFFQDLSLPGPFDGGASAKLVILLSQRITVNGAKIAIFSERASFSLVRKTKPMLVYPPRPVDNDETVSNGDGVPRAAPFPQLWIFLWITVATRRTVLSF